MSKEFVESWSKYSTASFGAAKELTDIYTKAFTKLGEKQLAIFDSLLDAGVKQCKLYAEPKGYKDLFSAQAKLMADESEKLLTIVRESAALAEVTKDELTAWLEKNTAVVMEPINKVFPIKKAA